MLLAAIALLVFASVACGTVIVLRPRDATVRRRLGLEQSAGLAAERRLDESLPRRTLFPFVASTGHRLASLMPANLIRAIDRLLAHADEPWSLPGFLTTWAVVLCLAGGMVVYVGAVGDLTPLQFAAFAILAVSMAALLPYAVLRRRAKNRQRSIARALPDALDLIVTSVEAGMGVDAAFATVTEKTVGPLSDALSLYLRQVGLGRARKDALLYVAERTGVPYLMAMANSVAQGEELGTSVGDVLRVQADDLRVTRRLKAQEAAQRAPILMTIPLVLCFLPAMALIIVVPSVLNLLDFVEGFGS